MGRAQPDEIEHRSTAARTNHYSLEDLPRDFTSKDKHSPTLPGVVGLTGNCATCAHGCDMFWT